MYVITAVQKFSNGGNQNFTSNLCDTIIKRWFSQSSFIKFLLDIDDSQINFLFIINVTNDHHEFKISYLRGVSKKSPNGSLVNDGPNLAHDVAIIVIPIGPWHSGARRAPLHMLELFGTWKAISKLMISTVTLNKKLSCRASSRVWLGTSKLITSLVRAPGAVKCNLDTPQNYGIITTLPSLSLTEPITLARVGTIDFDRLLGKIILTFPRSTRIIEGERLHRDIPARIDPGEKGEELAYGNVAGSTVQDSKYCKRVLKNMPALD